MEQITELVNLVLSLLPENPAVLKALAGLMSIRLVVKSYREAVLPIVKQLIKSTPTKKDDELLDKVEKSKGAKVLAFVLDLLFSIKLK
jgi:hypothetical protein